MKKQYLTTFLLCTLLSANSLSQGIDFGRGEVTVTVPSSYSSAEKTPLIILLHGYGSNGERQDSYLGFSRIADKYNFFLVAPTGTRESSGRQATFWNATSACCNFQEPSIDDNAYIMGIIERMKEEYNIDSNRVYLVGHSNGGFMSYQLAYNNSESIAAIVSLAGASHADERAAPKNPVHVLQIHGTDDSTIRYEGGDIQGNEYPGAMRAAAHEDVNLVTILPVCAQPGLELRDKAGHWHKVVGNVGDLIINSGDMLQEATAGFFPSTPHRVINPEKEYENVSRVSMPYFLTPRLDVRLSKSYTAGEFLAERIALLNR